MNKNGVQDGLLGCEACKSGYPIIGGIPRLLPYELMELAVEKHPAYFRQYRQELPVSLQELHRVSIEQSDTKAKLSTGRSFGYEWTTYDRLIPEWQAEFRGYTQAFEPSYFSGKLILDAGCGMGRFPYQYAQLGADHVFGLDLSEAVEVAYRHTKDLPNVTIIQGDLYNLPFEDGTFDFASSLGVLLVLPRPEEAFRGLLATVKLGGNVLIYMYKSFKDENLAKYRMLQLLGLVRRVTVRMPHGLLNVFCTLGVVPYYLFSVIPYFGLRSLGVSGETLSRWPIFQQEVKTNPYIIRKLLCDRAATPIERPYTRVEMLEWFSATGCKNVTVHETGGWNISGRRVH
jgi:SAM-dependent methyltransferase